LLHAESRQHSFWAATVWTAHLERLQAATLRLDAVLEFKPRQVARQQQIAFDGADIDRTLGGDF
jgi:hypothetical protein